MELTPQKAQIILNDHLRVMRALRQEQQAKMKYEKKMERRKRREEEINMQRTDSDLDVMPNRQISIEDGALKIQIENNASKDVPERPISPTTYSFKMHIIGLKGCVR